jgi:hypothetical protein
MSGSRSLDPQAGYTLAETLAALLVVGLAVGGLMQAAAVIERMQGASARTAADSRALGAVGKALAQTVDGPGLYRQGPGGLAGDATGFSLDCGRAAPCAATVEANGGVLQVSFSQGDGRRRALPLRGLKSVAFVYEDAAGAQSRWPPVDAGAMASARPALKAVSLVATTADGPLPLARVRVWADQAPGCAFDPIIQACRRTGS